MRDVLRGRAGPCPVHAGAEEIDYVFHYQSNKTFSSPEALHGSDLKNLNIGHAIKQQFGEDQLTHGFL